MTLPPPLGNVVAVPARRGGPYAASDIVGSGLAGSRRTLRVAGAGRWALLLFLGSRCDGCLALWEGWACDDHRVRFGLPTGGLALAVTRGPGAEQVERLAEVCARAAARSGSRPAAGGAEPAGAEPAGAEPAGAGTSPRSPIGRSAPAVTASLERRLILSDSAWRQYRVLGPPFFALVDPDARVATEGVGWAVEQVAGEVHRAVAAGGTGGG